MGKINDIQMQSSFIIILHTKKNKTKNKNVVHILIFLNIYITFFSVQFTYTEEKIRSASASEKTEN